MQSPLINREASWLEFNQRVLDEAQADDVPALEQLKFLAITASNLDEFFMVRVGGLRVLAGERIDVSDPAGGTVGEQLKLIGKRTRRMVREQYQAYRERIMPALAEAGIRRVTPQQLSMEQTEYLHQFFEQGVLSVISPMAVDGRHAFPLLRNLGLYLATRLRPASRGQRGRVVVMPFGIVLDRFITLPAAKGYAFILLEDAVRLFIERLLPGEIVAECRVFRITRNADLSVREDYAADFLAEMEGILAARRTSRCVRLEVEEGVGKTLLDFLHKRLGIGEDETYRVPGPVDLSAFMKIAAMDGFEALKYPPWRPQRRPELSVKPSIFAVLAEKDILLCHPYDSFEPVLRFLDEAADDPDVLAIKQTLYRTSRNSPVIEALRRAAENGKYVTAVVELKARFDEARNIEWARHLEEAGVQVIYGVKRLKTHAKVCIVARREPRGIVRYLHFGTGNYNELTARLYSDISYMTADEVLGADASAFFNAVTGCSQPQRFQKLEAAPSGLREKLLELIEGETARCQQGQKAGIMAKLNSLVDPTLIKALYAASQAGVNIRLNVRGICCLRPGIEGLSERIVVNSIVDRFLEHSRIFWFLHGGEEKVFISSADWMPRNLDRRLELLVPVDDPACRQRLIALLHLYFTDNEKGRVLQADGRYVRAVRTAGQPAVRSQEVLCNQALASVSQSERAQRTVFEPLRPSATT